MREEDPVARLARLAELEKLSDTLDDRDGGELFRRDLEEARALARHDPRFEALAEGLARRSLGARLAAVDAFFKSLDPGELTTLQLPPHLAQLRTIFLRSR